MYMHEIALLVAVLTPATVVVGIDVYLAFHGETETLLLPRILAYPLQPLERQPIPEPAVAAPVAEPDDEPLRKAA